MSDTQYYIWFDGVIHMDTEDNANRAEPDFYMICDDEEQAYDVKAVLEALFFLLTMLGDNLFAAAIMTNIFEEYCKPE